MTPTLLHVTMITGLDIRSPDPAAHRMVEVPFKLSSKTDCTNWSTYMNQHMKTKGQVGKKGTHNLSKSLVRIFHLLWSFLSPNQELSSFGLPSGPWQPHQPRQAFPRKMYRCLHLMTTSLLSQRKLRTGGPWWFIQLWAQLYFQHQIPNSQSLAKNSFPDKN